MVLAVASPGLHDGILKTIFICGPPHHPSAISASGMLSSRRLLEPSVRVCFEGRERLSSQMECFYTLSMLQRFVLRCALMSC
jgi:hypothetical protein